MDRHAVDDDILKHLVVARLCQPTSKAGTVDYLKSYFDEDVELHKIYRYLDRLQCTLQDKIQQISVEHTRRILEGRTMIPIVEDFVHRFNLEDFVVVADSGLMNSTNIALWESSNYKYIIGARIKNEAEEVKQWILSLDKTEGHFNVLKPMFAFVLSLTKSTRNWNGF